MFSVGDTIKYGNHGICKIMGTQDMTIDSKTRPYYVLKPLFKNSSTIYLPIGSEIIEKKMRPALTAEEIYALIRNMPDAETIWVENVNERKEIYKKILLGNDSSTLMRLIKTLYLHGQELKNAGKGKKLHASDERFLKDAENVLYDEFSYVLDIERDEVLPFINKQIEINTKKAGADYEIV